MIHSRFQMTIEVEVRPHEEEDWLRQSERLQNVFEKIALDQAKDKMFYNVRMESDDRDDTSLLVNTTRVIGMRRLG